MISLAEINAKAKHFKVPTETVEKDYVICWILLCIAKSELKKHFIFYGGTAIKRVYFDNHRFSEDIDLYSTEHLTLEYILNKLDSLEYAKDQANITLSIPTDRIISGKGRHQIFVEYSGYEEIIGAPKNIRLDFSMKMDTYGETADTALLASYTDLLPSRETLNVTSLNTILANKLGLLNDQTRNEPRDLFDVWFLLQRIDEYDFNFAQVVKFFKEKYSYKLTQTHLSQALHREIFVKKWEERLAHQIQPLPDIKLVIKEIESIAEKLYKA